MPLANLGLVSRLTASDLAAIDPRPAPRQRVVRCAAGFYADARAADAVAQRLRAHIGLGARQMSVIHPGTLSRRALDQMSQRWQSLRPRWRLSQQAGPLALGVAVGMLVGLLTGWLAGLGAGSADAALLDAAAAQGASAWLLPELWTGALAGGATSLLLSVRRQRHRFDSAVARQLRHGRSVVVVHGIDERQAAPVLACLQESSDSWCAEAPRRRHDAA